MTKQSRLSLSSTASKDKTLSNVRTLDTYFTFKGKASEDAEPQRPLAAAALFRVQPQSQSSRGGGIVHAYSPGRSKAAPASSSPEIVRLCVAPSSKSAFRFYNSSLRGVYDSCLLPTESAATRSNMILSSMYSANIEQRSAWRHTVHAPPSTASSAVGRSSLALPFLKHTRLNSSQQQNKTARRTMSSTPSSSIVSAPSADQSAEPNEDGTKKRKRVPFKRAVALEGRQRSWKVRMLPTKEQATELKRCIGVARDAYNFANKRVREDKVPANRIALRNEWEKMNHPPEVKAVARRFVRGAIYDLVDAYTSNYAKLKTNPRHKFVVLDRDEVHSRTESLQVERRGVLLEVIPVKDAPDWVVQRKRREAERLALGLAPSTPHRPDGAWRKRRAECLLRFGNTLGAHGPIRIQSRQKTIDSIVKAGADLQAAARIQWNKHADAFYFIWCFELPPLMDPDPAFEHKTVVALDPGCTPFQKWYSPSSGEHGELLFEARPQLKQRCLEIDRLRGRIDRRMGNPHQCTTTRRVQRGSKGISKRKRQRLTRSLRKKLRRECRRLSGHVESAHYDAANFLLRRHEIVIAPILATTRLTDRKTRCFGSKLARTMYTWSHFLFRRRLAFAAARWPGRYVFECVEPGTSKTCTHCGLWNPSLKLYDKVCRCSGCGVTVDRQLAGARNNFFAAYGMAMGVGWDGVGG